MSTARQRLESMRRGHTHPQVSVPTRPVKSQQQISYQKGIVSACQMAEGILHVAFSSEGLLPEEKGRLLDTVVEANKLTNSLLTLLKQELLKDEPEPNVIISSGVKQHATQHNATQQHAAQTPDSPFPNGPPDLDMDEEDVQLLQRTPRRVEHVPKS